MATQTPNLNLIKPELADDIDPSVFAENFDIIDSAFGEVTPITISITFSSGETEKTIEDDRITENSLINVYTSKFGVNPTNMDYSNGSLSIGIKAQDEDVTLKLTVYN